MDDRLRWAFVPWPHVLQTLTEDEKENCSTPPSSTPPTLSSHFNLKDNPFSNSAVRVNCYSSSPARHQDNYRFIDFGSPISKVINSPRGEEVIRIHALEKEVKSLRELKDEYGREKDRVDELCQAKDEEIRRLKGENER